MSIGFDWHYFLVFLNFFFKKLKSQAILRSRFILAPSARKPPDGGQIFNLVFFFFARGSARGGVPPGAFRRIPAGILRARASGIKGAE